ncbi:uncharacterized protein LOC129617828 [Condylostylus longicornis]|uniref:uncharacterized protein LOC129617828 n=1 Tax=Condylostylus longicornis TaxID=2530218 RepID=UPI00244DCF0A|nr:uncharacterized protein LOC129617828 [Condylostylus longicornis]
MYDDIAAQSRELDKTLDDFRETLRHINNFNAEDRRQRIYRCGQLEQQAKTLRSAILLEIKAMDDEEVKNKYKTQLKEKNRTFKNLCSQLEMKKNEIDRDLLEAEANEMDEAQQTEMTTQQVIAAGDKIQDQTQDSVNRMKALVADAEAVGIETAGKMDAQIVQMGGIAEGLNDVEYNVKRAQTTARTIAKNAMGDRCIQILCLAIVICVVIIIVLAATK